MTRNVFSVARFAGSETKRRREPGVARCALTPGYFLSPLRGEDVLTRLSDCGPAMALQQVCTSIYRSED